jgi:hypothetical protein
MCVINTVLLFKGKIAEREGEFSIILEKAVNLDQINEY